MYAGRRYKAEKARHLQKRRQKTRRTWDSLAVISYPGLTPEASVNTRFESLESVAIATASGINERPAGLILLVEVESFSGTGRAGSAVNWFFADRCIITTKTVTRSIRRCHDRIARLISADGIWGRETIGKRKRDKFTYTDSTRWCRFRRAPAPLDVRRWTRIRRWCWIGSRCHRIRRTRIHGKHVSPARSSTCGKRLCTDRNPREGCTCLESRIRFLKRWIVDFIRRRNARKIEWFLRKIIRAGSSTRARSKIDSLTTRYLR